MMKQRNSKLRPSTRLRALPSLFLQARGRLNVVVRGMQLVIVAGSSLVARNTEPPIRVVSNGIPVAVVIKELRDALSLTLHP